MNTYAPDPWAALGDRTRRTIFARLAAAPSAVGDLADSLPISRPAVSQHLRVLKDAGLITAERAGTRRIYRVDPDGLHRLRSELDTFWSDALTTYKRVVEDASTPTARHPRQPTDRPSSKLDHPPEGAPP